jgi:RNA polymerase sigma factor (sigma-70 family)
MLVDDYEIVRTGLRTIVEQAPDMQVVADVGSSQQVIEVCMRCQPDVLLMDFTLDREDGPHLTGQIRQLLPGLKVVILTCMFDIWSMQAILSADASGYLIKNASADQIIKAIRQAYNGEPVFAPEVTRYLLRSRQGLEPHADSLTEREQEVLRLIAQGCTNKEIASQLNLSQFTVKNHVGRLRGKLGASTRAEAAALAIKLQLVHMD